MNIGREQWQDLEKAFAGGPASALEEHLRQFSPRLAEAAGSAGVTALVQHARKKAYQHQLSSASGGRWLVECMALFGWQFDSDPQYAVLARAIERSAEFDPGARLNHLHELTVEFLDRACGKDREHERHGLSRLLETDLATIARQPQPGIAALTQLRIAFPERCAVIGEGNLMALAREAAQIARDENLDSAAGDVLCLGLCFTLGHGFARDPLYPWVSHALEKSGAADTRIERLYAHSRLYLQRALEAPGKEM